MLIATLPLLPRYRYDIAHNPLVDELRYNTIMPLDVDVPTAVSQLLEISKPKPLWIDLKTRQLRVTKFAYLPYDYVELSHRISVNIPTKIYFKDCVADIEQIVDGYKLILGERPMRVVGAGEPVNILDPSLEIDGFLTDKDCAFIEAARSFGCHNYLLSFVEKGRDIEELLAVDPEASIIAKIESPRGLDFVRNCDLKKYENVRLMAARDDLYINMGDNKMDILSALSLIIQKDPRAIAASRIFTSLMDSEYVSMGDISDFHMLHMMGYSSFMLSDEICRIRDVFRKVIRTYDSYKSFSQRDSQR